MVCKKCGARLADDAVFCTECGEKINSPLCCPECGNELEEGSKFCVYCGADLTLPKAVKTTAENKYIPNYNTSGYEQLKKKNKFPVAAIVILAIVSILVISFAVRAVRRKKYEEELERLAEEYRQESNNSYSEPETYLEYSENSPVEILNAWTAEYMDRPIFVVSYRWTNTENTNQSALYNVSVSAYQNGIELEKPIFYDEDDDAEYTYQLVGSIGSDPEKGKITTESSLGAALLGKEVGNEVEIICGDGSSYKVVIKQIK